MEHELEEIKAEQGLLAKQYTAVAKSLISSKSHRLSIMIQALKKGEKLSVFESIYRSQTTAHEKDYAGPANSVTTKNTLSIKSQSARLTTFGYSFTKTNKSYANA